MVCIECKCEMIELSRERVMDEEIDDLSDGQMGDYCAAELAGDLGDWGCTEITYWCKNCGVTIVVIED